MGRISKFFPDYNDVSSRRISPFLMTSEKFESFKRWRKATSDLIKLGNLGNNWDGEGAVAPDQELIDSAIDCLKILSKKLELPPPTRITSSHDGEIVFEWQNANEYFQAEIKRPFQAKCMHYDVSGNFTHFIFPWKQIGTNEESYSSIQPLTYISADEAFAY